MLRAATSTARDSTAMEGIRGRALLRTLAAFVIDADAINTGRVPLRNELEPETKDRVRIGGEKETNPFSNEVRPTQLELVGKREDVLSNNSHAAS